MKKNNNLAPILSEKNILARIKNPSPPPLEYQMDCALLFCQILFALHTKICNPFLNKTLSPRQDGVSRREKTNEYKNNFYFV